MINKYFYKSLLVLLLTSGITNLSAQQSFASAEEKIFFNKNNGLPKYEGVIIEYRFKLVENQNIEETEVNNIINHFTKVLNFRLEHQNGFNSLFITTEGEILNHNKYNEVLLLYPSLIQRGKRIYILK